MGKQLTNLLREIGLARVKVKKYIDVDEFIVKNGKIPADYIYVMSNYYGGGGAIGDGYIELWEPKEIFSLNIGYQVEEFAPGFTIFGSNGGDTAFAFERNTGFIYHFPFIGMTIDEPALLISELFEEFLKKVKAGLLDY